MAKIEELRKKGSSLYLKGQVANALKIYNQMFKNKHYNKKVSLKDKINDLQGARNMAHYLNLFEEASNYAKKILSLQPDNFHAILTLSMEYLHLKQYDNAIKYALMAKKIDNTNHTIYDILAEAYMHVENFELSKEAGIQALTIKSKNANQYAYKKDISKIQIPKFSNNKTKNIISFSLFGDNPKYCENAVLNAKKVSEIYPSWSCRFYCDTDVPSNVIERLKNTNAQVIIKEKAKDVKHMLFWRFLVMGDPSVDRYIVRDCDSVISKREAFLVKEWVKSNKKFHIIRDFYTHTDLILAGLFGGINGLFLDIEVLIDEFLSKTHTSRTHLDQKFLTQYIWNTIKNDVLIHDSKFHSNSNNSIDFPQNTPVIENFHIGMNEGSALLNIALNGKGTYNNVKWSIKDQKGNIICQYDAKLQNNKYSVNIPTVYVKKIQNKEYFIDSKPF